MIYFDYAATTPVAKDIANGYSQLVEKYFYNSESLYAPGIEVNRLQEKSGQTSQPCCRWELMS